MTDIDRCYEGAPHDWSGASFSAAWNCNVQCCRQCGHLRRAKDRVAAQMIGGEQ